MSPRPIDPRSGPSNQRRQVPSYPNIGHSDPESFWAGMPQVLIPVHHVGDAGFDVAARNNSRACPCTRTGSGNRGYRAAPVSVRPGHGGAAPGVVWWLGVARLRAATALLGVGDELVLAVESVSESGGVLAGGARRCQNDSASPATACMPTAVPRRTVPPAIWCRLVAEDAAPGSRRSRATRSICWG